VPADDLLNLVDEAAHKTIGAASGDSRKLRPKQAKGKKVKQDEQLMPRPPGDVGVNEDNGDPSRQNAVTAAASAPAATEDISALRQLVNSQQCVINKLLSHMNFVLSSKNAVTNAPIRMKGPSETWQQPELIQCCRG
jgi:hypothetical protein